MQLPYNYSFYDSYSNYVIFSCYTISNPFKINASCNDVYKNRVSFIFKNYVIVKNIFMDTRADIAYISHIDSQHCL